MELWTLIFIFLAILPVLHIIRISTVKKLSVEEVLKEEGSRFGFFHPFYNTCGGGERVLWTIILTLFNINPKLEFIIYASTESADIPLKEVIKQAAKVFDLPDLANEQLIKRTKVVHLKSTFLLRASTYPRLTLILQSLGSCLVAIEALIRRNCDVFFDTTGFAFTFPCVKLLWASISSSRSYQKKYIFAYIHYPTISLDMISVVQNRVPSFNNDSRVAKSQVLSSLKTVYYSWFSRLYGFVGSYCDRIIVNSTWTKNHIDHIWKTNSTVIFPPCNISTSLVLTDARRQNLIVSLGQFRPEKNHRFQLEIFSKLRDLCLTNSLDLPKFVLMGGCRNAGDFQRVDEYKNYAQELNILGHVEFKINLSFEELSIILRKASIGLHTMIDEHFGIAPVELQNHGLIVVAHNSGGPKQDIIDTGRTGFLAESSDEFAQVILSVLKMKHGESVPLRLKSIQSSLQFSTNHFKSEFTKFIE